MSNFALLKQFILEAAGTRQVDEPEALQIAQKFSKALGKKGIDVRSLKPIAAGTRGVAFDAGNDKVLKITGDDREASASSRLQGSTSESLVKIYDVWQFSGIDAYGILQEKLADLSAAEVKEFNNALILTRFPIFLAKSGYDWDAAKNDMKEYARDAIKSGKVAPQQFNDAWGTLVKFGMRKIHDALGELGISFHDYHGGNLMKRSDGSVVLIDPGMSKVAGSATIPTLLPEVKRLS